MTTLDHAARRRAHKRMNWMQSILLVGGMGLLLAVCALMLFGPDGVLWVLAGGAIALLFQPKLPPEMALRLYRARRISSFDFPEGYQLAHLLADRAELPRPPDLYYVPSTMLNAFALGDRSRSVVAISDGILRTLSVRELAAVLAHEISHIRNNDLGIMTLADSISRFTGVMSFIGQFLLILNLPLILMGEATVPWLAVLLLIFAPTIAALLQLALSRTREYDADLDAVELTGDPRGLAMALDKLERYEGRLWERLFMPGRKVPEPSLLRTHPPTEERIRRLLELEETGRPAWGRPIPGPWDHSLGVGHLFPVVPRGGRWRWPGVWY